MMKKIFIALCCVMIGSAFGADIQGGRPDMIERKISELQEHYLANMQIVADMMIEKRVGGDEMQKLWCEMKEICERGKGTNVQGGLRRFLECGCDAKKVEDKIEQEIKKESEVFKNGLNDEGLRVELMGVCIDACFHSAKFVRGKVEMLVREIFGLYEKGVEALGQGKRAETLGVVKELIRIRRNVICTKM